MTKIVGLKGCSRCEVVRNRLKAENIDFKYEKLTDLEEDRKREYAEKVRDSSLNFPIIIQNDEIVDIEEVI